ncbi:hypothetical protein BJX64DRAFT_264101 [Aspergillus heterothallicus]
MLRRLRGYFLLSLKPDLNFLRMELEIAPLATFFFTLILLKPAAAMSLLLSDFGPPSPIYCLSCTSCFNN